MTKQNEAIIKKQDFGQWVNIDLYKDAIMSKCKGKLDISEVSTLSNMFAIIFAMKARDYVNYVSDQEPMAIEKDAEKCANNLLSYLQNYPAIRRDWLELFVIGYSGESISLQGKEQEYQIAVDDVSNDVEDDEYAIHAALFVSSLDDRLSQDQQQQITRAVIDRTSRRKAIVKARLARQKGIINWKKKFRDFIDAVKGKKFSLKNLKKLPLIPVTPVIRGGITAAGMIIAAKLFPAYGFATLVSGGAIGYMTSNALMNSFRKISNAIFYGRSRVAHVLKATKRPMASKKQAMKIEKEVDYELDSQIHDLKARIDEEIRKQKEMLSSLEEQKTEVTANKADAKPILARAEAIVARRNGGVLPPGKRAGKESLAKLIDDSTVVEGLDASVIGDVNATPRRAASVDNRYGVSGVDGLDVLAHILKKAGASSTATVSTKEMPSKPEVQSSEAQEVVTELDHNSGGTTTKTVNVSSKKVSMGM